MALIVEATVAGGKSVEAASASRLNLVMARYFKQSAVIPSREDREGPRKHAFDVLITHCTKNAPDIM